jgi:hypothetical protein
MNWDPFSVLTTHPFTPNNNVFYIGKYDIRFSSKVGSTNFRQILKNKYGIEFYPKYREIAISKLAVDGLYRKNSIKVCVFRDPIDKWLSAVNWLIEVSKSATPFPRDINQIIDIQTTTEIIELKSQYYSLGNKNQYDTCYPLYNISKLISKLTTDTIPIKNSAPKIITKKNLTDTHIAILKEMYKEDYINGWHYKGD